MHIAPPIPRTVLRLSVNGLRRRAPLATTQNGGQTASRLYELPVRVGCTSHWTRQFSPSATLLKKGSKAKGQPSSTPDLSASNPTAEAYDVSPLEAKILKAIERLTHELSQLRAGGRFNPDLVEGLKVELGTQKSGKQGVKLGDIAQVVPKGRLLNIMVGEKEHIKPVTSAIAASPYNLAPQQPHHDQPLTIPVPIPPPTGESRRAAIDAVKTASEAADRAIHDARAAHHKKLRKFQIDRSVLPDDLQKANKVMAEVVKKGHAEVKRIADGAKKVLEG